MEPDRYKELGIIGKGSFGIIKKVQRKSDGQILCRKEISYKSMKPKEREQLQAELSILKGLRHRNIVAYYEREHIKSSSDLHIYMEYCEEGDLARKIKIMKANNQMAEEDFVWSVFAQLVCGLYRCHKGQDPPEIGKNVIGLGSDAKPADVKCENVVLHRDLKPENIFLGADASVKIGDFGLSKILASHDFASTYVGTPFYMSPEICAAESYGWASDIWALGCVAYELCAKEPPFNGRSHLELIQNIRLGKVKPLPAFYSRELQNVIMQCIRVNQNTRPDTATLLNLPMVKLKRKEMEMVELGRRMQARVDQANQTITDVEQSRERDRDSIRRELDTKLRREWEVKARLEIDRQVERVRTQLENDFNAKLQSAVRQELANERQARRDSQEAMTEHRRRSSGKMERSSTPEHMPENRALEELSLNSPTQPKLLLGKKSSRTPFTRSKTVVDSPMEVDMIGSATEKKLGLSPRRSRPHSSASNRGRANIFAATSSDRDSVATSGTGSAAADDDSDGEGLPLPSPTEQRKDPFLRPSLKRQQTVPIKNPRPQSAIFNRPLSPSKSKENLDPQVEGGSLPITRPSKLPARPTASPTKDLRGRSLVDLSATTVPVWDPERDEMPSPFLQRQGRPPMKGYRGGPGFSHLR